MLFSCESVQITFPTQSGTLRGGGKLLPSLQPKQSLSKCSAHTSMVGGPVHVAICLVSGGGMVVLGAVAAA